MSYELKDLETILSTLSLSQQADIIKLKDDKGFTLLLKAASQNYYILVEFLIKYVTKKLFKVNSSQQRSRDEKVFLRNKVKQIVK